MRFNELSWKTSDGILLCGGYWQPPEPTKIICLIHGLGEHCRRYEHVAEFFARHGWATFTFDQRGHGKSGGRRGVTPGYERLMDDIQLLFNQVDILFPGVPKVLYGHSMGGNQAANFVLRRKPAIQALVLSAAFFRLPAPVSSGLLWVGKALNRVYPAFTQSNGLDVTGISRDPKEVQKYLADPLNHARISVRWGLASKEAGEWAIAHACELRIPTLVSHGSADRLTAFDGSQAFAHNNPTYVTFKAWEGWYHELHNEPERQEYLTFVADWLNTKLHTSNTEGATHISFENQFEKPVTSQQAQVSQSFYKVFHVDGLIKKKEKYVNNELVSLIYYLDGAESESQAVALILQEYRLEDVFEIRRREEYGIYKKEICKLYLSSGVYDDYTITSLYDTQNRLIYEKDEIIEKGILEIRLRKYFYDSQNTEYEFIYTDAGILCGMSGTGSPFVPENNHFITVDEFPLFFPNFLRDNPYYADGNP